MSTTSLPFLKYLPSTAKENTEHPTAHLLSYIGIGVDFGTSNSAAAIFDGKQVTMIKLGTLSSTMPSATYINKDFLATTGQEAIDNYIDSNVGRKVELGSALLGEGRTTTGQLNDDGEPMEAQTTQMFGQQLDDLGMEGRLFRGTKRLLSNKSVTHITLFHRPYRLVALLTPILLVIRKSIERSLQNLKLEESLPVNHACIGYPVNFEGGKTGDNELALQRLGEAYGHAGIKSQSFCPEPIAAALSYLFENNQSTDDIVLTVDFGGGTLDLCILQKTQSDFEVVATHGIGLGGDHIDQRIFKELVFPLLGKGEQWKCITPEGEFDTLFPFSLYEDLLVNWAITYSLNQNKYTAPVISAIEQGGDKAVKFHRLLDVIYYNYSYLIFQSIKDFKAKLSVNEEAALNIPEIDVDVTLARAEFESMIAKELSLFEKAVEDVLKKASMRASDINLTLHTGGSSLIPAVKGILNRKFPGKVAQHDPLTSVASGLAIASYYYQRQSPEN